MKTETPPFDPTQDTVAATTPAPLANPAPAGLMWATADNTRQAYKAALRQFGQSAFPEADAGVAAYLMRLHQQGRSAACAGMVVSALRFRAKLSGRPSPIGAAATRVLAGFRRLAAGRDRGMVAGVRWE